MKASLWKPVQYKKVYTTVNFDDINTFLPPLEIGDTQATDLLNLTSSKYPALKVRNGKILITTLTTVNGLGQRNNEYINYVDGVSWKNNDILVKTLSTSATGTFEEFNVGTTKYTIFSNGTDKEAFNGTTTTALTNAPSSKIFTTHKGRIYWARSNDIVYSALNSINDYSTPNDAGTIDVTRAKGSLVSLFEYNDRVLVFTEFSLHALYGTSASNFELIDIEGNVGCFSDLSVCIANKKLYWCTYDGIYEFDGSTPIKVSEPYGMNGVKGGVTSFIKGINVNYRSLVASGSFGDLLYVSIPYGSSATKNNLTLVFDTKLRKWYVRNEGFVNFVTIRNYLYGVDTDGKLWDMTTSYGTDGGTDISWYWISKAFSEGSPSSSLTTSDIWLSFKLPVGSTLKLAYSDDVTGSSFTDLITYTPSASEQVQRAIVPITDLQRISWRRLKLYGTGDCEIYFMEQKGRQMFSRR